MFSSNIISPFLIVFFVTLKLTLSLQKYISVETTRGLAKAPVASHHYLALNKSSSPPPEAVTKLVINQTDDKPYTSVSLLNYFNVQYYGTIYVGSNNQKFTVVFDTGSNLLWIPSSLCVQCRNYTEKFYSQYSTSARYTNEKKNITYALGYVEGDVIEDKVSINEGIMSIESFRMLLVNFESDLEGTVADGILGLGLDTDSNSQSSFIYSLYRAKEITTPVFSFYLTDSKKLSRLFIGDIFENAYVFNLFNKVGIKGCNVEVGAKYWQCQLNEISIEDLSNKTTKNTTKFDKVFFSTDSRVIFDSGTSYIIVPGNDFLSIVSYLMSRNNEGEVCGVSQSMQLMCQCKNPREYGKLVLFFDKENYFEINFEDIIDYFPTETYQCQFEILVDVYFADTWILGDSALRSTVMTFNLYEKKVSWVQLKDMFNEEEMKRSGSSHESAIYITWVIAAVSFLAICCFLAYCFMK